MQNNKNTEVKRALCFGCWLQAGVLATVTDGTVVNLRGEPGHPVTFGPLLCRIYPLKKYV